MKNVLLINPPFNIAKDNYDSSLSVGLLSIASYLSTRGVQVEMIDGVRQSDYLTLVEAKTAEYDVFGISVMTTQISQALTISQRIKAAKPNAVIVWGGVHPTFFPEQTIVNDLIDIVVSGEGEGCLWELASSRPLPEIPGIIYKDHGQVKKNGRRMEAGIESLPTFNWDLVPAEILRDLELIPSLTSRGCPHRCTFCINAILQNRWRGRSAEQVLADLRTIDSKDYFRGKKLRFWDENFFVDITRVRAIIEGMLREGLARPWETTIRADYIRPGLVDDDLLTILKRSGCYLLSFGAESGSPRILKMIEKDLTPEQIINSAKMCLKRGIIPQYSFMIGLPGEEKSDIFQTLKLIDRLLALGKDVQILGPQVFRPYPGSELYGQCLRAGWQEPRSLPEWSGISEHELNYLSVNNFPWIKGPDKDLVESMEAYVRFGAHPFKSALGSSVKANKLLKIVFILLCELRWRAKFFSLPWEFKLAKKFVTNRS